MWKELLSYQKKSFFVSEDVKKLTNAISNAIDNSLIVGHTLCNERSESFDLCERAAFSDNVLLCMHPTLLMLLLEVLVEYRSYFA